MTSDNINGIITLAIILLIVALFIRRPRWKGTGSAHGTSSWATHRELAAAGMLGNQGLIIGRTLRRRVLRLKKYTHIAVYAPTGAGKGVSLVIITLLTYTKGSVFVNDPKGENFRLTAKHRKAMGQIIFRIDAFEVCGPGGDCFNPLDLIPRDSVTLEDDAGALSESIVVRPPEGDKEPHWNNSAAVVIKALIVWVLLFADAKDRNLNTVREALCHQQMYDQAIVMLCDAGGIPAQLGGQLKRLSQTEKEWASVLSTALTHTAFLDSRMVSKTVQTSTFQLDRLLKTGTTVFFILPVDQADAQKNLLRLYASSFMRYIIRNGHENRAEVLFLLDECSQLGGLSSLSQALELGRGSGIRLMMIWQTYSQSLAAFKDKPGLVADNSDCQIYFGVNTIETAERINKMLGAQTITITTWNESGGTNCTSNHDNTSSSGSNTGWSFNYSEHGRDLLLPAEVLALHPMLLICFCKGVRPILARRLLWYGEKALFGLAEPSLMWWLLLAACVASLLWSVCGR